MSVLSRPLSCRARFRSIRHPGDIPVGKDRRCRPAGRHATVDRNDRAVDVRGVVRREEGDDGSNLLRFAQAALRQLLGLLQLQILPPEL